MRNEARDARSRDAVIYCRVSSDRQEAEGYSLPAQVQRLREYASRHGLRIVQEFVAAESAKDAGRRVFEQCVGELKRKGGPRVLLVEKADRATRNFHDFLALEELRRVDVEIHSTREGLVIAKDADPSVELMWSLQVAFARHYVSNLSREAKKGREQKLREGGWPHRAPIGYLNTTALGRHVIVPDPERAPLVRRLFARYAEGAASLRDLAGLAEQLGLRSREGRTLDVQAIGHILRGPIYAGLLPDGERRGEKHRSARTATVREGAHEAIVDRDLWNAVQRLLDDRARRPRRSQPGLTYSGGFLRCGACGGALTGFRSKGRSAVYRYYGCSRQLSGRGCAGDGRSLREADVEAQLAEAIECLRFPEDALRLVREALEASEAREREQVEEDIKRLRGQEDRLRRRLATAYQDRLDERITPEEYDEMAAGWRSERDGVRAKLDALERADAAWRTQTLKLFEWVHRLPDLFRSAPPDERRTLLEIVSLNRVVEEGRVKVTFAEPFDLLAVAAEEDAALVGASVGSDARRPIWLRRRDLNPQPSG